MSILDRALITSGIKLEIIRLTRMPDRVRAAGVAIRIGRCVYDIRAGCGQRVDIRRRRVADDVGEGMILFDNDDNVVVRRRLCVRFRNKASGQQSARDRNDVSY